MAASSSHPCSFRGVFSPALDGADLPSPGKPFRAILALGRPGGSPHRTPRTERGTFGGTYGGTSQLEALGQCVSSAHPSQMP